MLAKSADGPAVVFHRREPRTFLSREEGEKGEGEGRRRDGSIAAVEIEITRLSAHPSYQDGRRFPLKVHQARANPFRLPPPRSPLLSTPAGSDPPTE